MKAQYTLTSRLVTLAATAVLCWAAAMGCTGGSGVTEIDPPPVCDGGKKCVGPGVGEGVPSSVYIPTDTDVLRVDIAPYYAPLTDAVESTKTLPASSKPKGFMVKNALKSHIKIGEGKTFFNKVTPYGEIVQVHEDNTTKLPVVSIVGPDGKSVNVLQNRSMSPWTVRYDSQRDQLVFIEKAADGFYLKQRDMLGHEKILYKTSNVLYFLVPQNKGDIVGLLEGGEIMKEKMFILNMSNLSLNPFPAKARQFAFVDKLGKYVIYLTDKAMMLSKSDFSKQWQLTSQISETTYVPHPYKYSDTEFMIYSPIPGEGNTLWRISLQDGSVTKIPVLGEYITGIIDRVGDKYLVWSTTFTNTNTNVTALAWLSADGTLSKITGAEVSIFPPFYTYNSKNGVLLCSAIVDGTKKLVLLSSKTGKIVASLEGASVATTQLYPNNDNWPVVLISQKADKEGVQNVGLLSPDVMGGDSGKDLNMLTLGSVNGGMGYPYVTDVFDSAKVRKTPIVVDNTPPPVGCLESGTCDPCVPVCDGKQCGDDGCGGVCGDCGAEKICGSENMCVEKTKTSMATVAAANFKIEDALIVSNGTMQTVIGETPKLVVKGDVPPNSVYVICGNNVSPYLIQKFVLSADPNDPSSYALNLSGIQPEISESPKFACTTTVSDASGNLQYLKLNLQVKDPIITIPEEVNFNFNSYGNGPLFVGNLDGEHHFAKYVVKSSAMIKSIVSECSNKCLTIDMFWKPASLLYYTEFMLAHKACEINKQTVCSVTATDVEGSTQKKSFTVKLYESPP